MQILSQNYLRKCKGATNDWVKNLPLSKVEPNEIKNRDLDKSGKQTTIKLSSKEETILVDDDWKSYPVNSSIEVFAIRHDCEILKVEWLTSPHIIFSYKQ